MRLPSGSVRTIPVDKNNEVLVNDLGKLLQEWIAADIKAASAEKWNSERGLLAQDSGEFLDGEAERLRAIANAAREKLANFVLTDGAVAGGDGEE